MESTRIDKWLWAVRVYKTRTLATEACRGGHVRLNGTPAKASTLIVTGDRITAFAGGRERILEVRTVIDRRVGAAVAAQCVVDHSPPPPEPEFAAPFALRDHAAGRPTKKDRRSLDRLRRG